MPRTTSSTIEVSRHSPIGADRGSSRSQRSRQPVSRQYTRWGLDGKPELRLSDPLALHGRRLTTDEVVLSFITRSGGNYFCAVPGCLSVRAVFRSVAEARRHVQAHDPLNDSHCPYDCTYTSCQLQNVNLHISVKHRGKDRLLARNGPGRPDKFAATSKPISMGFQEDNVFSHMSDPLEFEPAFQNCRHTRQNVHFNKESLAAWGVTYDQLIHYDDLVMSIYGSTSDGYETAEDVLLPYYTEDDHLTGDIITPRVSLAGSVGDILIQAAMVYEQLGFFESDTDFRDDILNGYICNKAPTSAMCF